MGSSRCRFVSASLHLHSCARQSSSYLLLFSFSFRSFLTPLIWRTSNRFVSLRYKVLTAVGAMLPPTPPSNLSWSQARWSEGGKTSLFSIPEKAVRRNRFKTAGGEHFSISFLIQPKMKKDNSLHALACEDSL